MKKLMLLALSSITLPVYADSIPPDLKNVGTHVYFPASQTVWPSDDGDWPTDRIELMSGGTFDKDKDEDRDKDKVVVTPEPSAATMVFFTTLIFGTLLRRKIVKG